MTYGSTLLHNHTHDLILIPGHFDGDHCHALRQASYIGSFKTPHGPWPDLRDGKRLFGDHKTWKGFLAYPFFAAIWTILLGFLAAGLPRVEAMNYLYVRHENRPLYNLCVGLLLGFAYALFELPNSFIKRRLAIDEGKMATGPLRPLFIFIDQADSVIGCVLVLALVYPMSPTFILAYILLGAGLHILLNYLLALVGLRKERR